MAVDRSYASSSLDQDAKCTNEQVDRMICREAQLGCAGHGADGFPTFVQKDNLANVQMDMWISMHGAASDLRPGHDDT